MAASTEAPLDVAMRQARRRRRAIAVAGVLALALAFIGIQSCRSAQPAATPLDSPIAADPALPRNEPDLRVRIRAGAKSVEFNADAPLLIGAAGATPRMTRPPVTIALVDDRFRIHSERDGEFTLPAERPIAVERSTPSGLLDVDRNPHPGAMELHARRSPATGAREFDVVELVPLETYLPGVIAKELYASWTLTAFEVQAIAARTYALHEALRQRGLGRHYDLESTTRDQVYGGATANTTAHRAVRATAGQVLLDEKRRLLRAYYSSDCGGRPASAADTFPTTRGYEFNLALPIQAAPGTRRDFASFSPVNRWTVVRSRDELVGRFAEYGKRHGLAIRDIRSLEAIEIDAANSAGRPTRYRVRDASGRSFTLSAEQIRNACNQPAGTLPEITRQTRALSGDARFTMRAADVVIEGRGFGHGVGLCQFGAEGMAREGRSTSEILSHFYPGAAILGLYSPVGPTAGAVAR